MGAGVIANQRNQSTGSSGNNLEVFGTIVLVIFSYILGTILFLVGLFLLFWLCIGLYMGFSTCYDILKEIIIEFKNCKNTCCGFCRKKWYQWQIGMRESSPKFFNSWNAESDPRSQSSFLINKYHVNRYVEVLENLNLHSSIM